LCWHYSSSTGCRNSNCRWRHQNLDDQFCQKYVNQTRGNGISNYRDSRKTLGAPFYQIKQHQDGGVEDQYVLVNYLDMDKKGGFKKSIQFQKKLGYWQESDHTFSSRMSILSPSSAPNSISATMLMSPGTSDSEGDMVKNDVRDVGKFQKRNSCGLADLYGEVKTRRRRMKKEWLSGKKFTSSFSPFAKVFVPRKSMMSKDVIRAGLKEMILENLSVNTIQQPGNLSCLTEDDEVFE